MTTTTKKQRERRALDSVLGRFSITPATEVAQIEEPDFLLSLDGVTVGVEVTEIYLPTPPNCDLPLQATENEERIIIEMARKQAIQLNLPPQQLQLRLAPRVLRKDERNCVSAIISEYIASNYAAPGEIKFPDRHALPREIIHLTMYGLHGVDHVWNGPCTGWTNDEYKQGFQDVITTKESKLCAYYRRCQKCWLIVVATAAGGSSFIEWSDALARHAFPAAFERVFFVQGLGGTVHELTLTRPFPSRESAP